MSFLELLKLLTSFGPKLKEIWPQVQAILAAVKAIQDALNPTVSDGPGVLQLQTLTADEDAELEALSDLIGGPTATIDIVSLLAVGGMLKSNIGKAVAALLQVMLEKYLAGKG